MGSDHDSINIHYSSIHDLLDDDYDEEVMDDQSHLHLSRLSRCTSNSKTSPPTPTDDEEDELELGMSALSMDDGEDADAELSDKGKEVGSSVLSSDSDGKEPRCYSLPATPPRRRTRRHGGGILNLNQSSNLKEYASENEAQLNKGSMRKRNQSRSRRQRSSSISFRERWMERAWWGDKKKYQVSAMDEEEEEEEEEEEINNNSGESESLVITSRPKGEKRALCMDLEEVKACKELGFDLEHEMVEIPGRISMSCSTNENSSGGSSPIANWRISSPGDDPRDVKARLKVWAQAVAIASTSHHTIS